jgi:hypothetical protein
MVGMGAPVISPSVYTALCQGTPVVLPYFVQNPRLDGWHLYSGYVRPSRLPTLFTLISQLTSHGPTRFSQHGPASQIGPPYVYSYYSQNYTSLLTAVHSALTTPIERYIPDNMKLSYAMEQLRAYVERDLIGMFERVLRGNGGEVPRLIKGARERCYELERCRGLLAEGRRPSIYGQSWGT